MLSIVGSVNNCIYKMFRFFHNNVSDCLSRSSPQELIGQHHLLEPSESKFVSEIRRTQKLPFIQNLRLVVRG